MPALEINHLSVHFDGAKRAAVDDVSFSLEPGQIAMLVGPNGCGKTTLIRAILGFIPAAGTVQVYGRPASHTYHRIGYVPQYLRFDATLPLTGREILRMPLQCLRHKTPPTSLDWAVSTFHLARFIDQSVGTLSVGEFKRLLLARAMLHHPRLLLLDEPEAGVDVGGEQSLYQLLEHLVAERQLTALISSHELDIVLRVATQVVCLNRRLLGIGPPMQILTPQTIFQLYGPSVALYRHDHEGHA
ncbi:Zinc import ATP-binding protein ZnuC [Candidatus Entotheonellaceae bacterium PAL068K]